MLHGGDAEHKVELQTLSNGQRDAGLRLWCESFVLHRDGVGANWNGRREEAAFGVGGQCARRAGFGLADGDGGAGNGCAADVVDGAADGAADDLRLRGQGCSEKNEGKNA